MIENISVMDKPVEKAKGLSRGMWLAVIGGVVALAAVLVAIPTIRRWSRVERSISQLLPVSTRGRSRRGARFFYSSKQSGSGLGLPLCTEILAAHGGSLRLQRRPGGGTAAICVLPSPPSPGAGEREGSPLA